MRGDIRGIDRETAAKNLVKALGKGVLKVMSKMGVSTVASYTGAQIFEAVGLGQEVVDDLLHRHDLPARRHRLRRARRGGRSAATAGRTRPTRSRPRTAPRRRRRVPVAARGRAAPVQPRDRLQAPARHPHRPVRDLQGVHRSVDDQAAAADDPARPVPVQGRRPRRRSPIDEVEPVDEIVKRFSTGAMSYGSISQGGARDPRHRDEPAGRQVQHRRGRRGRRPLHARRQRRQRRSAIKQVASGRFGVTSEYLVNADDLQIKMAQGAKPGEGGQLPGHKVYPWIAKTRHSTPGVGLISPPPHHDIYSIEDLAQLIHDLKNANPAARVHVKLVAEVGVGTVAAGVAKAHADVVLISGHDGGTGASPADLAQARRRALGARPGRDPADAAAQRPARPDRRADRRAAQDRPRRGHRRAARRRGVRLRHRAAGRDAAAS